MGQESRSNEKQTRRTMGYPKAGVEHEEWICFRISIWKHPVFATWFVYTYRNI